MDFFLASEFQRLYESVDEQEVLSWNDRERIKLIIRDAFDRKVKESLDKEARVSDAEVQIALGTFNQTSGDSYTPGSPNKIFAIKLIRDRTGLGLRESKDLLEAAVSKHQNPEIFT